MRIRTSYVIRNKIKELTSKLDGVKYIENRNPRNLEQLRIGYKPNGYFLDKPGRNFWNKLELNISGRHVTAQLVHFEGGSPILKASTSEWAIKKQLFKTNDASAFINLAKVFGQRCLQTGIIEMRCDIERPPNGKIDQFLSTLESTGISLAEPIRFTPHRPWDMRRPEKPWEVDE